MKWLEALTDLACVLAIVAFGAALFAAYLYA